MTFFFRGILISIAVTSIIGDVIIIPIREIRMSPNLFMNLCGRDIPTFLLTYRGVSKTFSSSVPFIVPFWSMVIMDEVI